MLKVEFTPSQIAHVRQLHAEQEHLDTVAIGKAAKLPPYVVQHILHGHPSDDVTPEQVAKVKAQLEFADVLGDVSVEGVDLLTVSAIHDGMYDQQLPAGWDLV